MLPDWLEHRQNAQSVALAIEAARQWLIARRRGLGVGAALVGAGMAATAFGIAPLAPDAALLPRTLITERIQPNVDLHAQIEALAEQRLELYRSETTRKGDTPESLLSRLGAVDAEAAQFIRSDKLARRLFDGRAAKQVRAKVDSNGRLLELVARYAADTKDQVASHFTRLSLRKVQGKWSSQQEIAELKTSLRLGSGTIRTSLFAATDEALVPDGIAAQMAEMFAGDIDFHRELKRGDTFSLVYESLTADGEPINWNQAAGRILAAEFVNGGRRHQALWFNEGSKGGYYDFSGKSKRRAFLASPMEFSRITSGFAMRLHPIHQEMRAHLGVDYGAPTGTAARSVADGVVETAGWNGGYGNMVVVRHSADKSTLYAHLSRVDVKRGERILQGQRVGLVGATGTATGPHLHFEFRVNGRHMDPLKVARNAQPIPLAESSRPAFTASVEQFQSKLMVASTLVGTSERGD